MFGKHVLHNLKKIYRIMVFFPVCIFVSSIFCPYCLVFFSPCDLLSISVLSVGDSVPSGWGFNLIFIGWGFSFRLGILLDFYRLGIVLRFLPVGDFT
jgi:hypothetical protein